MPSKAGESHLYRNFCRKQASFVCFPLEIAQEDCINLYEKMKAVGKADGNPPYVRVEYAKDEDNVIGYVSLRAAHQRPARFIPLAEACAVLLKRKHLRAYNEASLEDDLPLSEGTCSIRLSVDRSQCCGISG